MTLPAAGNAISINSLVGEFGGSAPHAMNEYYRGGGLVADHSNTSNIPTSGTIQLDDFHGTSAASPDDVTLQFTPGAQSGKFPYYGFRRTADGTVILGSESSPPNNTITIGGTTATVYYMDNQIPLTSTPRLIFSTTNSSSTDTIFGTSSLSYTKVTISSSAGSQECTLSYNSTASNYTWSKTGTYWDLSDHFTYLTTVTFSN